MKTIVNTVPEAEIAQTFPRLFSKNGTAQIAIFGDENVGTWLTGDFAGLPVALQFNVYNNTNWDILPIGYSITLVQE